jgi:hypothetical protein
LSPRDTKFKKAPGRGELGKWYLIYYPPKQEQEQKKLIACDTFRWKRTIKGEGGKPFSSISVPLEMSPF